MFDISLGAKVIFTLKCSPPPQPFFCLSPAVILEKQIRIPRSLSVKAASVLKGFLNKVRRHQTFERNRILPL